MSSFTFLINKFGILKDRLKNALRGISFFKSNFRKFRKIKESIIDFVLFKYYTYKGYKIFFSHYARVNNFGDRFNKDLIEFFGYKLLYVDDYKNSYASLTGSILTMYGEDYNGYILGSGFIKKNVNRLQNKWKTLMIRGPLSCVQCNCKSSCFYGDPGILASLIYDKTTKKKYKLGLIPHDIDLNHIRSKSFGKDIKVINVRRSPHKVAKEIQQCDFIASSSLHGLIFADSFMIPNIHIRFGNRLIGGNHKFIDYYLGMDEEHEFIEFDKNMCMDEIIKKCKTRFSSNYIKNKQDRIMNLYSDVLKRVINDNIKSA